MHGLVIGVTPDWVNGPLRSRGRLFGVSARRFLVKISSNLKYS
jgi:hypothetical protein